MRGAEAREAATWERTAWLAKTGGMLAQADPRKAPSIDRLLGRKAEPKRMRGREIGRAMKAWVAVTKRG